MFRNNNFYGGDATNEQKLSDTQKIFWLLFALANIFIFWHFLVHYRTLLFKITHGMR